MCYKIEKSSFETDERGETTTAKERVVKSENLSKRGNVPRSSIFDFNSFHVSLSFFSGGEKKQSKKDKNLVPSGQSINLDASAHNRVTGFGTEIELKLFTRLII